MGRFLAGAAAMLLIVAAGLFLWTSTARTGDPIPRAPATAGRATAALADPPAASDASREAKRFARYDRDRDGKVEREEYLLARRKSFAKLDTNGDGRLSFEEYAVKTIDKFAHADADKSGALSAAEFATTRVVRKAAAKCACGSGKDDDD